MSERIDEQEDGDPGEKHLTHVGAEGTAQMVDIADKLETDRLAVAQGVVSMASSTLDLVLNGQIEKGEVFSIARLAAITGANRCLSA